MDRIDRIGPRTEGPQGVLPPARGRRVERRDPDEDRRDQPSRRPRRPPVRHDVVEPGHVDVSA